MQTVTQFESDTGAKHYPLIHAPGKTTFFTDCGESSNPEKPYIVAKMDCTLGEWQERCERFRIYD